MADGSCTIAVWAIHRRKWEPAKKSKVDHCMRELSGSSQDRDKHGSTGEDRPH